MVSIFKKKEIEEQLDEMGDTLSILRELEKEEDSLMEEKRQLLTFKEKLLNLEQST